MPEANPFQAPETPPTETVFSPQELQRWFLWLLVPPVALQAGLLLFNNRWPVFFQLVGESLEMLKVAWPVLTLVALATLVGYRKCAEREALGSMNWLWLVPNLLAPSVVLTWGASFAGANSVTLSWIDYCLLAFLVLTVFCGGLAIFFNSGRRWLMSGLVLLLLMGTWLCLFPSAIAVSGDGP